MNGESIKDEEFYGDVKSRNDKPRRKHYCPYCGNEMKSKVIGNFAFCNVCHRKMPWTILKTDDKPIKPL